MNYIKIIAVLCGLIGFFGWGEIRHHQGEVTGKKLEKAVCDENTLVAQGKNIETRKLQNEDRNHRPESAAALVRVFTAGQY